MSDKTYFFSRFVMVAATLFFLFDGRPKIALSLLFCLIVIVGFDVYDERKEKSRGHVL